jgi:hypothetical protein
MPDLRGLTNHLATDSLNLGSGKQELRSIY